MDFKDHRRELDENQFVYAVVSRRSRGLSIGVNLNPDKRCNFDCPYCQVDRRTPGGPSVIDVDRLSAELDSLLFEINSGKLWNRPPFDTAASHLRRVNDIAFAGDGEPTAAKAFEAVVRAVGAQRMAHGLEAVQMNLLTNATLFHKRRVRSGLRAFWALGGAVWAKLDAGTESWFHRVDGTQMPFQRILDNLTWASLQHPIVLQCMFHRFGAEGPSDSEISAWIGRMKDILTAGGRIHQVQVYSVARKPSSAEVEPLADSRLREIATAARTALKAIDSRIEIAVY